ncbi:ATP-binding protein [Leadbetterella sp. DM7]|uniref:sensor histidine kinase n=1 Tax=Leadbetterella sp. DM7 TaxID=3235085 RepID=UPI00349EF1BF
MRHISVLRQILIGAGFVILLSVVCYLFRPYMDYRIVALILLLAVSLLAVLFDILPVLVSAVLSALILNLFFIEPVLHYKINSAESALLFFIYMLVALVNAVLTNRLRKLEARTRDKEEKEKTIQLYNTLLSSLSHELKTPIATIIGAVDTLKETGDKITAEQKADLLAAIDIAGSRLNNQVENLLNMSRLETGMLTLKRDWCDINELIFMVIGAVPGQGGHTILFEPDDRAPLFKIDEGLMEIVLYSIISNAVRYTPPGTEVRVSVGFDDDQLHMVISDNGKGIPEEKRQQVFEKFYRMPRSGTGGTGLGLSIAKGIVDAHKGEIRLADSPSGGAEFSITLPAEVSYLKNLKNE